MIAGQCSAECDLPKYEQPGTIRCVPNPACTPLGCTCKLFGRKVRSATWEFIADENVQVTPDPAYRYRCYCVS